MKNFIYLVQIYFYLFQTVTCANLKFSLLAVYGLYGVESPLVYSLNKNWNN